MAHVLPGCPEALKQGCYTWTHDSVLSQVEKFISQTIDSGVKYIVMQVSDSGQFHLNVFGYIIRLHLGIDKREAKTVIYAICVNM